MIVPTVVDVEINLALAASDALKVIEEPAGITKPLVVVGVVPSKVKRTAVSVAPPSACTTAWLQPASTVSCATAATESPSWCETYLPHDSTLTPSVIEPSVFGCWDILDRFRCV